MQMESARPHCPPIKVPGPSSNILNYSSNPSNTAQDIATVDGNSVSDYGYAFGQFMDHDLDLTLDGGESMPIAVAANDPIGPNAMPFTRS